MAWSLIGTLLLAAVHLFAGKVHTGRPSRSWWLSAAGGFSIAYVFLDLIPELAKYQAEWLADRPHRILMWFEGQLYLEALIGALLMLGLDRAMKRLRRRFWLQTSAFAVYNVLIGTVAVRVTRPLAMILAVLAFGGHFLIDDQRMALAYDPRDVRAARWVLAAALVAGWAIAALLRLPPLVEAAALGLLAGGMILHIVNEEMRDVRERRLVAFVAGALGYAVLLIALEYTMRAR